MAKDIVLIKDVRRENCSKDIADGVLCVTFVCDDLIGNNPEYHKRITLEGFEKFVHRMFSLQNDTAANLPRLESAIGLTAKVAHDGDNLKDIVLMDEPGSPMYF